MTYQCTYLKVMFEQSKLLKYKMKQNWLLVVNNDDLSTIFLVRHRNLETAHSLIKAATYLTTGLMINSFGRVDLYSALV